ncbi:MAG: hypothetical protein K8R53_00005, partial [Bacteroidales bacterium]|nr:hypothetical protein [Bacteroidales bacterium]
MKDNYQILIRKLDGFIRKFYINRLIKGSIYCIALWIVFFISVNALEYYGHFGIIPRTIIFYAYIALNVIVLYWYILVSLFKLYKIGKLISHEEASLIIGKFFPKVSDKLLNTLQLKELAKEDEKSLPLIEASIDQKSSELTPVPFTTAINLKDNIRYTRYLLPPVVVLIILIFAAPSFITEPSSRLIQHSEQFTEPDPFSFIIKNTELKGIQYEDFRLEVQVTGDELPAEVLIQTGTFSRKL